MRIGKKTICILFTLFTLCGTGYGYAEKLDPLDLLTEGEPVQYQAEPVLVQPVFHHFDQPEFDPADYLPRPAKAEEITTDRLLALIDRGASAKVLDLKTGLSFAITRLGGDYHMDVEPSTKEDTAVFMQIVGKMSWDRRAIVLLVDDKAYAASMNGMAHMPQRITGNNFPGHFCIHVRGSLCHGSNYLCPKHQGAVDTALAADLTQYTWE